MPIRDLFARACSYCHALHQRTGVTFQLDRPGWHRPLLGQLSCPSLAPSTPSSRARGGIASISYEKSPPRPNILNINSVNVISAVITQVSQSCHLLKAASPAPAFPALQQLASAVPQLSLFIALFSQALIMEGKIKLLLIS